MQEQGLPKAKPRVRHYALRVVRNTAAIPSGRYLANLYFAISVHCRNEGKVNVTGYFT
jgi:hypothetical protein